MKVGKESVRPEAIADSATDRSRLPVRRGLLAALLTGAGALSVLFWGTRPQGSGARGYQVVWRWRIPGGEGRFIALAKEPSDHELRTLGERLREEFSRAENAVAMVFDDVEAARQVRRGSRIIGEERFQSALRRQRAMYVKQAARGEHSFTIYSSYPGIREEIRY